MHEAKEFTVPKWPFFLGDAFLLGAGYFVYRQSHLPLNAGAVVAICLCIGLAALLGLLPFILEYRGLVKLTEAATLGSAVEKIQRLEELSVQIAQATNQWESAQHHTDKTAAVAQEIAERMTAEAKAFTAFQEKMNDSEKSTLRLEVEKARRAESEWLQILVRMLDHVYALYYAAERSGQTALIAQIGNFQNACRDTARRIGLVPFTANAGEPFDAQRHKWADGEKPANGAVVSETVATGYTFQGRLARPAAVKLKEKENGGAKAARQSDQPHLPLETEAPPAAAPME